MSQHVKNLHCHCSVWFPYVVLIRFLARELPNAMGAGKKKKICKCKGPWGWDPESRRLEWSPPSGVVQTALPAPRDDVTTHRKQSNRGSAPKSWGPELLLGLVMTTHLTTKCLP